jgi:hypothetical protein
VQADVDAHEANVANPHAVTKDQVGLGLADNTSDADKPVSTAQAAADSAVQAASVQRANHTGTQLAATISDFAATVRATTLTGLSTAAGTIVTAAHTVLQAIGFLQKQVSDNLTTLTTHTANVENPHAVTKAQVGLGLADNTSDVNKPVSTAQAAADATVQAAAIQRANHTGTQTASTISDFAVAVRGTVLTGLSTAAGTIVTAAHTVLQAIGFLQKQVSDNLTTLTNHTSNTANPHSVTKAQVGLGNADNTSDANKPVSTATQAALDAKQNTSGKDASGGYAGLTLFKLNLRNAANTITSWFTTAATVARTWTMPDKDGTVAMVSDITKEQVGLGAVPNTDATNASNISSGTLADARLPTTLSNKTLGGSTTLSGNSTVRAWTSADTDIDALIPGSTSGTILEGPGNAHITVGIRGNDTADSFAIVSKESGNPTYTLLAFKIDAVGNMTWAGAASGNGSSITDLNASNLATGTVSDARLPTTMTGKVFSDTVSLVNATFPALKFTRSGAALDQKNWVIYSSSTTEELTFAEFNDANAWAATRLRLKRGVGIEWAGTAEGDGSGITNLSASNVTSGTMADARLPTTFGVQKTFQQPILFSAPAWTAFDVNGSAQNQQVDGLYICDLGSVVGSTNNPTLVAAIVGQVNNNRSIALSVDSNGYIYGFRSHSNPGTYTWGSKAKVADTLTTARTIALSGAATGTATSFNGGANITIPVTALNADNLNAGTVPDARLTGLYTGMGLKIGATRSIYSLPSAGSGDTLGRVVNHLTSYRNSSATLTGAIVFTAPSIPNGVMHNLDIVGQTHSAGTNTGGQGSTSMHLKIRGYFASGAWGNTRKLNIGYPDVTVRLGIDPTGKPCVILGSETGIWGHPHIAIAQALFSHSSLTDAYCENWTATLVTDLTGYTGLSTVANTPLDASISGSAPTLTTARTIALSGAATGTATSFNGGANITIPVTGLNADDLNAGTVPNARLDATLAAIAGQNWAANSVPVGSGVDTVAQLVVGANQFLARSSTGNYIAKTITDYALTLLDDIDATAARTTLGLVIGTNVQAYDATLAALASADWALNSVPIGSGANTLSQVNFGVNTFPARSSTGNLVAKTITDFGLSLVDDADAATARTTLGLGNVTNTSDANKPVSTAQQTALDLKADLAGPVFTGAPAAPTAAAGTNTTQLATTAHVYAERSNTATLTNKTLTNPTVTNFTETVYAPAAGTAFTVNLANGTYQRFTTNGNITITLPAAAAGKNYLIEIVYGGAHTVTWAGGTAIFWPGATAPTATSVNGKVDAFFFRCPSTGGTFGVSGGSNY